MTREIKFRAWDKEDKKMEYDILFSGIRNLLQHRIENLDIFEVMQYTGLKDKNGKEIYEGDILKSMAGDISAVEFDDGSFVVKHKEGGYDFIATKNYFEIIGNIYENSELIKN